MKSSRYALLSVYLAWFVTVLFYGYQYFLRVAPGVMFDEVRGAFDLSAEQFGALGAYYLYAYALLQIPIGILVDRLGLKRVSLVCVGLCVLGGVMMAQTELFFYAKMGRFLMGAGSSVAFMGALKLVSDRLPPGERGFFMGVTLTFGCFAALSAGKPLVYFLQFYDWRQVLMACSLAGVPIFVLVFFFMPKREKVLEVGEDLRTRELLRVLMDVIKNPGIMIFGVLAIGLYTPLSVLADLWGTAFVMQKFGFNKGDAAQVTLMLYLGLALGCLVIPGLADKYNRVNFAIRWCAVLITVLFSIMVYAPMSSGVSWLMFMIGVLCASEMLCFSGALALTDKRHSGTTIGVLNTFNMLGGAFLQHGIGAALDWQWTEGNFTESGLRAYTTEQFVWALSLLVAVLIISAIISLWLKRDAQRV